MHGAQCSCAVTWGKQSLPISTFMTDSTDGTITKEAERETNRMKSQSEQAKQHSHRIWSHQAPERHVNSRQCVTQHARSLLQQDNSLRGPWRRSGHFKSFKIWKTRNNKRRWHTSLANSAGSRSDCSTRPAVFSSADSGQGLILDSTPSLKHPGKSRSPKHSPMTHSSHSMPQLPAATQEVGNQVTFTRSHTHSQLCSLG